MTNLTSLSVEDSLESSSSAIKLDESCSNFYILNLDPPKLPLILFLSLLTFSESVKPKIFSLLFVTSSIWLLLFEFMSPKLS
jgi:hypothetical protein